MVNLSSTVTPVSSASDEYWTQIPKTYDERRQIKTRLARAFRDCLTQVKLSGNVRELKSYYKPNEQAYVESIEMTMDNYSYNRSNNEDVINAFLVHIGAQNSERNEKTQNYTTFMFDGVKVTLWHVTDGRHATNSRAGGYLDAQAQILFFGYGGLYKLLNIVLKESGFYLSEDVCVKYAGDNGNGVTSEFIVSSSGDCSVRLLGMSNRAYSDATYANFRNIGDIVTWILKGKYVSFSDFHMNEAKQYTGPDDYFGCDMFRQAVEFLRTADWESLTTPTSLPVTSNKHRLKLWEGWNPGSYREYTTMSENRVKYSLIGAKYNDAVIQEVTGLDSDTIPFKTFKPAFEAEISAKQDFEFFLLSSSEETIKSKIQETYQRLTA